MPNIELRTNENYVEGLSWGQAITLKAQGLSFLIPGVTYTPHVLNENGQVQIPVFSPDTISSPTELEAEGNFTKAKQTFVKLDLTHKVSAEFDGTFTVAGIVPRDWERGLNNATLKYLAQGQQRAVVTELEKVDGSELQLINGKVYDTLLHARRDYFDKTTTMPNIALVSLNLYDEILKQQVPLGVISSNMAYVNGVVGVIGGMSIIPVSELTEKDLILINEETLNIAIAGNIKQATNFGNVIGEIDYSTDNGLGFSAGMLSKTDIRPKFLGAKTYVHKPYGIKVIEELMVSYKIGGKSNPRTR